jgi:hypothetical protein
MMSRLWKVRILAPTALLLSFLVLFEPDHAVFVVFLSLVGICSMLVGRDLASAIPPKVGVPASLLVGVGVAVLYATGIVSRSPGYSQYLVYLAALIAGMLIPFSVLTEIVRKWRNPPK